LDLIIIKTILRVYAFFRMTKQKKYIHLFSCRKYIFCGKLCQVSFFNDFNSIIWFLKTIFVIQFLSSKLIVNFINILWATLSTNVLFPAAFLCSKFEFVFFSTEECWPKTLLVKCWWNWPLKWPFFNLMTKFITPKLIFVF